MHSVFTRTAIMLAAASISHQTMAEQNSYPRAAGWAYQAAVGIETEPAYTGSDEYSAEPDIDFSATYTFVSGRQVYLSLGEIGARFALSDEYNLTTALEYEAGRDTDDDPILLHFPEQQDTVEAQITLARQWGDFSIAAVVQPDILDRGKGLVYFAGFAYEQDISTRTQMSYAIDISFSDTEHANTEIGISPEVASLSGLSSYTASSGYKSTTVEIELTHQIKTNWSLVVEAELEFYGSNFSDSPLIALEGDDTNYELGVGLRYSF